MVSSIRNYMPTFELPTIANPKQIANNLTKIALPAIALVGLAYAYSAEAGPAAYALCVTECLALTFGAFAPACLAACTPFLAAPTP